MSGGRALAIPDGGYRRIAVLRLSSLGDVVLTLPVVDALHSAFPAAAISYWVKEEFADVVRCHPGIANVRVLEADARRIEDLVSMSAELEDCDLIVDLHRSARTRVLCIRQPAPVLKAPSFRVRRARWVHARWSGPPPVPPATERYAAAVARVGVRPSGVPRMHAGDEAERWGERRMAERFGARRPVALCPGAAHATKRWPEESWVALDRRLAAAGWPRLYFSLERERRSMPTLAAEIERAPDADWCVEPLPRMAALLSRSAAAVSNDSGLMHLAAARGLRVVAIFGSTSPVLGFAPAGPGHAVLCRNLSCQPCTLHGRERCPKGHFRCMKEITPDLVGASLDAILEAPQSPLEIVSR